ncbi:MAG: DUF2723 domain-containing protein [Chloroflexi bacterium]|nr:DUF2723 domain-containing protein [Chloroflexota bacterium]
MSKIYPWLGVLVVLSILTTVYLPTLQTVVNGSDDIMMIDVGETQIVLNTWGTLHPTGYPLYVILGNILTGIFKTVGISAATAPSLVSMLWGLLALAVLYALTYNLSRQVGVAMALTFVFGMTRFVWLHDVIAEVYSFSLLLLLALVALTLWRSPIPLRIPLLALIGGIAVAHYRGIALAAPAIFVVVYPDIADVVRKPRRLLLSVGFVMVGFLPYIYLPLRENSGATWAYGTPNTWQGFWEQFNAVEFRYLFGLPESMDVLISNWERVNGVLVDEVGNWGIGLGVIGLIGGAISGHYRKTALFFAVLGIIYYGFAVTFYREILPLLIFGVTLSLIAGIFLLLAYIPLRWRSIAAGIVGLIAVAAFYAPNRDYVTDRTKDQDGLQVIELAEQAPDDSILVLTWGPRYFALGFARDVQGKLSHIQLASDKEVLSAGDRDIVTPFYTFFAQPIAWWEAKLQRRVYPQAVAPNLVALNIERQFVNDDLPVPEDDIDVISQDYTLTCTDNKFVLTVNWAARHPPTQNYSVLVHLLDAKGAVIAQDDKFAPVFGLRPMNTWLEGELVRDVYSFDRFPNAASIRFGLYEQLANGEFQNYNLVTIPATCGA